MKKLLQTLLLVAVPVAASAQVTVSTSQYTAQQLVNDVLLSNSCYPATNVTSKTGTDFGSVNGIGYFQSNNSGFPFQNGIILSSGDALNAAGPYTGIVSGGSTEWTGDADISNYMANLSGSTYLSRNASVLEFDFTPMHDHISLDYIFASNEYGIFQCAWEDAIAIFLTNSVTGESVNIAVIPGTTIPVSTGTIRDSAYNSGCSSMNAGFFGEYYADDPSAPVNFRGATVGITASATVIPNAQHHLKIVVSDKNDVTFDSAVFLMAGSLNIGPFDNFYLLAQGNNICSSEGVGLYTTNQGEGFTYEWSKDGVVIDGETQSTFTPLTAGEYSVVATHTLTGCSEMRTITVEAGEGLPVELNLTDLVTADDNNDGFAIFDLTTITAQIENQTGQPEIYTVSFHETQEDAEYDVNAIANPVAYANIVSSQQTLYAHVSKTDSGCSDVLSFNLIVAAIPDAPTGQSDQTVNEGATLADLEVDGENIQWYDNSGEDPVFPDGSSLPLPLTTLLVDGTTYYASQTINSIESEDRFAVTVHLILGTDSVIFNGLSYYPNPVTGILNIENANGIDSVSVVNALGQTVLKTSVNNSLAQVDVSSLSNGVYFVTIASGNASKTIKIIKE